MKTLETKMTLSREQIRQSFAELGFCAGDVVFLHLDLERFPEIDGCTSVEHAELAVLESLGQVIGAGGTILLPAYTFSFCRQELFDVATTPAVAGPWCPSASAVNRFLQIPGVVRSADPIHSVAGLGPKAASLLSGVAPTCFGAGSVFDRLRQANGKICMFGLPLEESTFRHHVEEMVGVPFRYRKLFTGLVRENGVLHRRGWIYYVRLRAENAYPDGLPLERAALESGICRSADLKDGRILAVAAESYFQLTADRLRQNRWCTARGPAGDPVQLESARTASPSPLVDLPRNASMTDMIDRLWRLPRDIVSDGYDAALQALAGQLPMTIREYPAGEDCWGWIVPEKWTCLEAYLEDRAGRRIFSYRDNPLHVVSYSLPYEGVVSRETLLAHLHVHPALPDAVPFQFKYYERDWGLCCSQRQKESLTEDSYRVVIRTDFRYGTLKVGEVLVPGYQPEAVVLCAHLCHPHMVNDDLTGVVVGLQVMREWMRRPQPRYTYRFLIVPETIGSIAWLSRNEDQIGRIKAGLFLEMLGRDLPYSLQLSFTGNSVADQCFTQALRRHDPNSWTGAYRTIIGNDERQFNGPGVRIPMLSLSRIHRPGHPEWPYREYHSSSDVPELVPPGVLEDSCHAVLHMLEALESNVTPVNLFKGEPFCSRYGLHIDPYANPEGNRHLFQILDHVDGARSIAEIASACRLPFDVVLDVVQKLKLHGLAAFR